MQSLWLEYLSYLAWKVKHDQLKGRQCNLMNLLWPDDMFVSSEWVGPVGSALPRQTEQPRNAFRIIAGRAWSEWPDLNRSLSVWSFEYNHLRFSLNRHPRTGLSSAWLMTVQFGCPFHQQGGHAHSVHLSLAHQSNWCTVYSKPTNAGLL